MTHASWESQRALILRLGFCSLAFLAGDWCPRRRACTYVHATALQFLVSLDLGKRTALRSAAYALGVIATPI